MRQVISQLLDSPWILITPIRNQFPILPITIKLLEERGNAFHRPLRTVAQILFHQRMQNFMRERSQTGIFIRRKKFIAIDINTEGRRVCDVQLLDEKLLE